MRPEPNNDIDLLLRQLSGRNGVPVSETGEQHLDADELNSYVANALPAAARARYTEHVADCSSCRKLVVQLSAAQGPLPVQQAPSVVAPPGLKGFLANLFSPMVLRYAAPALGLIVIAAVGLFIYRPEQRDANVAQLREAESRSAVEPLPSQQPSTSPLTAYDDQKETSPKRDAVQNGPAAVAPVTKESAGRGQVELADQPADAAATGAAPPPPAPKVLALQNEPAPPPASSTESDAAKKEKAAADKRETADVASAETSRRDYNRNEGVAVTVTPGNSSRQDVQVRAAQRAASPVGGAGSLKRQPAEAKNKDDDESAAETRSVAGRRFRKSAGVWIDTDYDSSKSITSVARGSEQYRALIADEPSIKTIADELDGQIVVVWKGRTYRIR